MKDEGPTAKTFNHVNLLYILFFLNSMPDSWVDTAFADMRLYELNIVKTKLYLA